MIGTISLGNLVMEIDSMILTDGVIHVKASTVLFSKDDIPAEDTAVESIRGNDGKLIGCLVIPVPEILRTVYPGMNVFFEQDLSLESMTFRTKA